ncbi:MAG: hypothetical protein KKD92_11895 [Proteobacteria bacterium]|nr:hypothetical protein [Pseudomonadota bacterium]
MRPGIHSLRIPYETEIVIKGMHPEIKKKSSRDSRQSWKSPKPELVNENDILSS